jgi:hypothetical protein
VGRRGENAPQELTAVLPELYQSLLEHALVRTGTSELFAAALHALLQAASHAPAAFAVSSHAHEARVWS